MKNHKPQYVQNCEHNVFLNMSVRLSRLPQPPHNNNIQEIHSVVRGFVAKGKNPIEIFREDVMSIGKVRKWVCEFKDLDVHNGLCLLHNNTRPRTARL